MEHRVRDLLNEVAEDVPPSGSLPPPTRRRARRGMVRSVLGGVLILSVVTYGAFVGVRALTRAAPPTPAAIASCNWSRVPSPNVDPSTFTNGLSALAAVNDTDAWAIGGYYHPAGEASGPSHPLVEHWDGASWQIVELPSESASMTLADVAAVSSNDVWAVGHRDVEGGESRPLALHWDGAAWAEVSTPDPGKTYSHLRGVAAVAPDDVWAVGNWATGKGAAGTLAMHWDGSSWTIVPSPDVPPRPQVGWSYPGLEAVSVVATDDVWAVGTSDNVAPTGPSNTLVEHWDGSAWTVVPSPDVPASTGLPYDRLTSVHARAPDDVWAVGSYGMDQNPDPYSSLPDRTLALHWDGTAWTVVPTPVLDGRNALNGVTTLAANQAWAVGSQQQEAPPFPLLEQWDGSAWTVASIPDVGNGWLEAVAGTDSGDLWAAGTAGFPDQETWGTLVLHADCAS